MIQALAMVGGMASVHAEYPIPLGNVANVPEIFSSNVSFAYIDLLHEVLGEIWEIKPYYQEAEAAAIALAQVQMMNNLKGLDLLHGMYPTGMPYNWNIPPATWRLGSSFPMTPVFLGTDPGGGPNMFGCGLWMAMLTLISACGIIGVSPQHEGEPPGAGVYGAPMWSPDGAYLVFSHRTDYHADLWLYEIETKEYKNLNIDGDVSLIFGGSWQNSETLWFFLGGGASNLYKLNIRSNELEYVRTVISWLGFSIRPDTEKLVFSSRSGTQVDLYLSDLRFETIIRLTDSTDLMESYPLWSPDGRYLAYQTEDGIGIRDEHGNTWTIDAAVKGGAHSLAWSPENRAIMFIGRYDETGLYLVQIDGQNEPERIFATPISYVSWSPDGTHIAYTTLGRPGRNELHILPVDELGVMIDVE